MTVLSLFALVVLVACMVRLVSVQRRHRGRRHPRLIEMSGKPDQPRSMRRIILMD
ncbi:hypothetical protein ACFO0A_09510 [Novosphingobium tardum]|uniref:Uncharacterized protein n=1 Tax=Novosphingobium tardum TaxID=1538021 RepID=A0ABV8RSR8_9SPHN